MSYQVWTVRTTQHQNGDDFDGDMIGTSVDYETLPHTLPMTPSDFANYGDLEETQHNEQDECVVMIFGKLVNEYDRSAEVWYETYVNTMLERTDLVYEDN